MSRDYRLSDPVREVLSVATCDGNRLSLNGQLDRKLYLKVAEAIELMGGKWNKVAKAHLFEDENAEEAVADALATGSIANLKQEFQFFETPPAVALDLVTLAQVSPFHSVLEPSAGKGRIVTEIRKKSQRIFCCEIQANLHNVLRGIGADIVGDDFLAYPANGGYDRIVANPPFTRAQDVTHVLHMWEHLAPGGRLVSVMSPSWQSRQTAKHHRFRQFVLENRGEWIELPPDSFKASGTSVNTGIIRLDKEAANVA